MHKSLYKETTIQPVIKGCTKTGSTLKCRNVLGFDFTALTHLWLLVAQDMYILYILELKSTCF